MPEISKAVASTLVNYRNAARFSQEELADQAGIHRTYVSQMERGLKVPTLSVLFRVCNALNIKPHDFVQEIEKQASIV